MAQPSGQDFINGVTLANAASIEFANIDTEVLAATPYTDKGLIMWTTDVASAPQVPAANTTPKWRTYFWGRIQPATNTVTIYFWNPNLASDPTYLQWQYLLAGGLPPNSITGAQIALATITAANIASLAWAAFPANGAVGGVLAGNMPNPSLSNGAISGTALAVSSIANSKLLGSGVAGQILVTDSVNPSLVDWITSILAASSANLEAGIATATLLPIKVNAGGTGYVYGPHDVLQVKTFTSASTETTTVVLGNATAMTTNNATINPGFGSGGIMTFTPLSTSSTIVVEIDVQLANQEGTSTIGLFNGNALLIQRWVTVATDPTYLNVVSPTSFKKVIANAAITPYSFALYYASCQTGLASFTPSGIDCVTITEFI